MPRASATKVSKSRGRSVSKKVTKAKRATTPKKVSKPKAVKVPKVAKPKAVKVRASASKGRKSVTKRKASASKGRSSSKKTKSTSMLSNMAVAPEPKETPVKKVSKSRSKSKARTPSKSSAKKVSKARNYFTVSEDWTILEFHKRNSEVKTTVVAKTMAQKLGRSSESIRDRLKKYLSKISEKDHCKIQKAAKKSPAHYVHYGTDKAGGNRKTVTSICAEEPGLKNSSCKKTSSKKCTATKRVTFIDLPP